MTALADTPSRPAQVLQRALEHGRLPHGILLHGEDPETLESTAHQLAAQLLATTRDPRAHPDFFALRPANKMRNINVDDTRAVIRLIQQTANQGERKVTVVYQADRMNQAASNAFLKTLEEPPADTTILLLSTRPSDLLPTIRSRCINLRLPGQPAPIADSDWQTLRQDYQAWLAACASPAKPTPDKVAALVLTIYGLATRTAANLKRLADEAWASEKQGLPEDISSEQADALEVGIRKGIRTRLFTDLEESTRTFALSPQGFDIAPLKLIRAIAEIERCVGLLEVNFNDSAALELFLLRSLRIWSAR